jgi:hypothetical protein
LYQRIISFKMFSPRMGIGEQKDLGIGMREERGRDERGTRAERGRNERGTREERGRTYTMTSAPKYCIGE